MSGHRRQRQHISAYAAEERRTIVQNKHNIYEHEGYMNYGRIQGRELSMNRSFDTPVSSGMFDLGDYGMLYFADHCGTYHRRERTIDLGSAVVLQRRQTVRNFFYR